MPHVNFRVKELETTVNELHSELEMKSKAIEQLKNETKSVMDKCVQLKAKRNLIQDEPISQKNEHEAEVVSYIC